MDPTELAMTMLAWEKAQRHADELEAQIERAVLALCKTQTVGHVRATYSGGRKKYDYASAVVERDVVPSILAIHSKTVVDYRAVCKALEIEEIPFTQSDPSVSVKLLE